MFRPTREKRFTIRLASAAAGEASLRYELVAPRVYGLCMGYEDLLDHN